MKSDVSDIFDVTQTYRFFYVKTNLKKKNLKYVFSFYEMIKEYSNNSIYILEINKNIKINGDLKNQPKRLYIFKLR
jgi:hypothetical protein